MSQIYTPCDYCRQDFPSDQYRCPNCDLPRKKQKEGQCIYCRNKATVVNLCKSCAARCMGWPT